MGDPDALKAHIKVNDWNRLHLIARGNVLLHIINGHVMAVAVDDGLGRDGSPSRPSSDGSPSRPPSAATSSGGLIGVQIHTGPPMKIELKDVWLRTLGE